jgi:hypothetical protein
MKLFQALLVVGSAALPALLSAASPYDSLYVHVPFKFIAAGQNFPAGDYRVQSAENGVVLIQGSGRAAATISVPGAMPKAGTTTGLKFSSDGQREHLVGVQIEGLAARTIASHPEISKKAVLPSQ